VSVQCPNREDRDGVEAVSGGRDVSQSGDGKDGMEMELGMGRGRCKG